MIRRFIENCEKAIAATPLVLSSSVQKQFGPDGKTVYVKGLLVFTDSSILEMALFASERHHTVAVDKYRLHYMDQQGRMLFRYDNAPHHKEISSYPHHKHVPKKTIPSAMPSIKEILNEITALIIRK